MDQKYLDALSEILIKRKDYFYPKSLNSLSDRNIPLHERIRMALNFLDRVLDQNLRQELTKIFKNTKEDILFILFETKIKYFHPICNFEKWIWEEFLKVGESQRILLKGNQIVREPCNSKDAPSTATNWLNDVKKEFRREFHSKDKIIDRLSKPKIDDLARRRADPRQFKTFENFYMVKNFFTLGTKTVKIDEFHVIVTINKVLDLYVFNYASDPDGFFPASDLSPLLNMENFARKDYRRGYLSKEIIPRESVRVLNPGEQYLIFSNQKSVFYYKIFTINEMYLFILGKSEEK